MKNETTEKKQFSLYSKVLDFNQYIRSYIIHTIPSIHRDIKIHLQDECYTLAKNIFYATYNKGNIRMKYLVELRVNLSLIDMLLTEIDNLGCLKKRHLNVSISKLSDIKNIIYGWIINEEEKKK